MIYLNGEREEFITKNTQQGSHSELIEKFKAFKTRKKLREFSIMKPALEQMLKELF